MNMETKICTKCKIEKLATNEFFPPDKRVKDGFQSRCRECCREACREQNLRRRKNSEYRAREYEQNNKRNHARYWNDTEYRMKRLEQERDRTRELRKNIEYRAIENERHREYIKKNPDKTINNLTPEYYEWHAEVLKKDNYTCQECHQAGGKLEAHHIFMKSKAPFLKYEIWNGITLCQKCHRKIRGKEDWFLIAVSPM